MDSRRHYGESGDLKGRPRVSKRHYGWFGDLKGQFGSRIFYRHVSYKALYIQIIKSTFVKSAVCRCNIKVLPVLE